AAPCSRRTSSAVCPAWETPPPPPTAPPCTTGGFICFTSSGPSKGPPSPAMRSGGLAVSLLAILLFVPARAHANGAFPDSDSIIVPQSLPGEIVLGTNFGVLLSLDDGVSWTWSCEQPGNAFGSHYQMGAPPMNRLYAQAHVGGTGVLAYSDDASCSWQAAAGGIAGATVVDAFAHPTDAARVLALVSR